MAARVLHEDTGWRCRHAPAADPEPHSGVALLHRHELGNEGHGGVDDSGAPRGQHPSSSKKLQSA
jgi:hypothetical protein